MKGPPPLDRLARLAPTLSEAELRVALALTQLAREEEGWTIRISAAELADATGLRRKAVLRAVGQPPEPGRAGTGLAGRGLLTKRKGTATAASAFRLEWMRTGQIGGGPGGGGGVFGTPGGGVLGTPGVVSLGHQGSVFETPPSHEKEELSGPEIPVDIDSKNPIIDRLLKATPEACDGGDLHDLRKWLHGYQCKFGRERDPHPPDALVLAQLLAIAPLDRLTGLVRDLMAERKEAGYTYGWYVAVALQRIHGIAPRQLAAARAALKLHKRAGAAASGAGSAAADPPEQAGRPEKADPGFTEEIMRRLRAGGRGLK